MELRRQLPSAAIGLLLGIVATLAVTHSGQLGGHGGGEGGGAARTPALGPDDARIEEIRIQLETGTANGAGTDKPVLVWIGNHRHKLSRNPARDFAPGTGVTATLRGGDLPRTLGALRRASIVLALDLGSSAIASSWNCASARIDVRLADSDAFETYLENRDVGWLSLDEPPRRPPAFALQ
jgi:hypothetical protein